MPFNLMKITSSPINKQAVEEIMKCNEFSARYGLTLTPANAIELVETCSLALKKNGRIEFKGGIVDKLIKNFCDSPYIGKDNYVKILHELIEIFYFYKNETLDLISDDDLIIFMKNCFDGQCRGSLELLSGRELANLSRHLRYGYDSD